MFTGMLIPCEIATKSADGRYIIVNTYSAVNAFGPELVHTFTLYMRLLSSFTGHLDCKIRIYDRTQGNDQKPIMEGGVQFNVSANLTTKEGALLSQVIESQITIPQVKLSIPPEKYSELATGVAAQLLMPLDFVLSTNGHEMARTTVFILFNKAA